MKYIYGGITCSALVLCHYMYASVTTMNIIYITKKYTQKNIFGTKYMIIDDNKRHYCVNKSIWYPDITNKWHIIKEGPAIIQYYGTLNYVLGIYPNIIYINNDKWVSYCI